MKTLPGPDGIHGCIRRFKDDGNYVVLWTPPLQPLFPKPKDTTKWDLWTQSIEKCYLIHIPLTNCVWCRISPFEGTVVTISKDCADRVENTVYNAFQYAKEQSEAPQ